MGLIGGRSHHVRACEQPPSAKRRLCVRILYLVRNATAHQIDENLRIYQDRPMLLQIIQAVLLASFVLEKYKNNGVVV